MQPGTWQSDKNFRPAKMIQKIKCLFKFLEALGLLLLRKSCGKSRLSVTRQKKRERPARFVTNQTNDQTSMQSQRDKTSSRATPNHQPR